MTQQQALAAASRELSALIEAGTITPQDGSFRLLIIQNQITSSILEPDAGTEGVLDETLWHNGHPKDGREREAIQQLWSGSFTSKIWCNRQSRIVIMKSCYDLAGDDIASQKQITAAVNACFAQENNAFLGPIVVATAECGFLAKDLYPGDLVWFYNPYKTLAELLNPKGADESRYQGEEGSNVFYIGDGKILKTYPGDSPLTIEEKQEDMMSLRAGWKSIQDMKQAYEEAADKMMFINHLIQLVEESQIPPEYRPTDAEIRAMFPVNKESFPIWNKRTPKYPGSVVTVLSS
ncbi:MAG TPA: hypothetical protein VMG10_27190 [Gemmataceae bacterium]|nr:hypothetical protein [Gemmataceae bacterium]